MNLKVLDKTGKQVRDIAFPAADFGVSAQAVNDYVKVFSEHNHPKTACTKTKGLVSGGGVKPWTQKGTGRARAGSSRSPLWRGGGTIFGPLTRWPEKKLNKKVKQQAFKLVLVDRVKNEKLTVIEDIVTTGKTKEIAALLNGIGLVKSVLILVDGYNETLIRASRNMAGVSLMDWKEANAYELLKHVNLVVTQAAYDNIMKKYFEEKVS